MMPVPHALSSPPLLLQPRNMGGAVAIWTLMENAGRPGGIARDARSATETVGRAAEVGPVPGSPGMDEQRWESESGRVRERA
jgi:hypothetical protein